MREEGNDHGGAGRVRRAERFVFFVEHEGNGGRAWRLVVFIVDEHSDVAVALVIAVGFGVELQLDSGNGRLVEQRGRHGLFVGQRYRLVVDDGRFGSFVEQPERIELFLRHQVKRKRNTGRRA